MGIIIMEGFIHFDILNRILRVTVKKTRALIFKRERETETETETERQRETETETERQTDRDRE